MIDVSGMMHGDVLGSVSNEQRKDVRLLTKAEACRELGISLSTLDRRIASGKIATRKKPMGQRHRVYVVMEEIPTEGEHDGTLIGLVLAVALKRLLGLEKKVTAVEEKLRQEQERNSLMFEELKATATRPPSRNRPRPWWRFWGSPK